MIDQETLAYYGSMLIIAALFDYALLGWWGWL